MSGRPSLEAVRERTGVDLLAAADLLETNGLAGGQCLSKTDKHCALGAIAAAIGVLPAGLLGLAVPNVPRSLRPRYKAAVTAFAGALDPWCATEDLDDCADGIVICFSDDTKDKRKVARALRRAARRLVLA